MNRPLATACVPGLAAVDLRTLDRRSSPLRTFAVQSSDCSRKSAPSNSASAMPRSKTCLPLSCLFWLSEFSMITETARSAPIRFGRMRAAAPARDQAEEDLGQREGRDGLRDGAVGAVQTDLDAAAHRRAVVVREGRDGERGQALEDVVAALADGERVVVLLQQLDALEVGADREDERLAGDADADDRAGGGLLLDLVDRGVQVRQRLRAEGGRLGVVEAVVQRDEREAPGAERQVEVAYVRGRDDLVREQLGRALQELSGGAHLLPPSALKCGFSQMTVAPMPKPTHMVVRP